MKQILSLKLIWILVLTGVNWKENVNIKIRLIEYYSSNSRLNKLMN